MAAPATAYEGPMAAYVNASAARHGLDPWLLAAVIYGESHFDPNARSPAGAEGIAQFMPATARAYGVNPWDPRSAIEGAAHYLSNLRRAGGSWIAALRGYNTGSTRPSSAGNAYVALVERNYRTLRGHPLGSGGGATTGGGLTAAVQRLLGQFRLIGLPGQGTHSFTAAPNNWESDNAIDVAMPVGSPVVALADGVIGPEIGPLPGATSGGRFAGDRLHLVTTDDEFYYAHLSRLVVHAGQRVKRGQLLGYSGSANGVAHLHLAAKNATGREVAGAGTAFASLGPSSTTTSGLGGDLFGALKGALGWWPGGSEPGFLQPTDPRNWNVPGVGGVDQIGALAGLVANDPAYPLLWLLLMAGGLFLIGLGVVSLAKSQPAGATLAGAARGAGTAAMVAAA